VFANGANGERLGRLDLKTGRVYMENLSLTNEIASKLIGWVSEHPEALVRHPSQPAPGSDAPWDDLALRRPGQSLEPRIAEERSKLKARSRGWYYADKMILKDEGWAGTWIRGVKGEKRIGKVLEKLARRTDWRVLHSIPLPGGGDVDHLLIGSDGVIAVNTKHHPKAPISVTPRAVYIRSNRTEYLDDARDGAKKVARVLSASVGKPVEVTPCVAIVSGPWWRSKYASHGTPDDVLVATEWNMPRVLWDSEKHLAREHVDEIYEAARRSTTWT
jgi:hypothetical protein